MCNIECRTLTKFVFFKIKNKLGKARTGVIKTAHGKILTPGFAFVATHGTIKSLSGAEHRLASPELTISNTFHLFVSGKVKEIKKAGGLHKSFGLNNPIMTDSGGFQIFSLGWGKVHKIGKIANSPTSDVGAGKIRLAPSQAGSRSEVMELFSLTMAENTSLTRAFP